MYPAVWNALNKRPDPLDLIISDVINTREKVHTSYLFIQSDHVIVQQQRLVNAIITGQFQKQIVHLKCTLYKECGWQANMRQ